MLNQSKFSFNQEKPAGKTALLTNLEVTYGQRLLGLFLSLSLFYYQNIVSGSLQNSREG